MERIDDVLIVGLVGKAYSGKSTVAKMLVNDHGFARMAFGDALKTMLIRAGMCTHDECYVEKSDLSRWLMQKVGTEIFRKQVHPDYWVQKTYEGMWNLIQEGIKKIVIDDVRFPNEANMIRLCGGRLIRIMCPDSPLSGQMSEEAKAHPSETMQDSILDFNTTIIAKYGNIPLLHQLVLDYLKL